ncbi:hypothetical protein B7R25_00010 [Subtercola boreus]|uniref:Uncharacterized protein n=1 Tax=Subtercola boreus TaxID=120213 RepID=A0A3E0WFU7_9MICO|nr:hypothetical protein B7R24_00015 [Subtercola boreus]RFA24068.1 hypothetical protein B7R23_00015 [Subtercola boreus]RFA29769.1 hypothetical protein B7R25_00010 [Subtercola boreus]
MTSVERSVLRNGLREWGGPARPTDELARVTGFASKADLFATGSRIAEDIVQGRPMKRHDWTRALVSTEFVFASDVLGSGVDWSTTTGLRDQLTLQTLRDLQRHLVFAR